MNPVLFNETQNLTMRRAFFGELAVLESDEFCELPLAVSQHEEPARGDELLFERRPVHLAPKRKVRKPLVRLPHARIVAAV